MKMTTEEIDNGIKIIHLDGRLDMEGNLQIENQFIFTTSTKPGNIIVDLSNVSFVASIGVRTIISAAKAQISQGGRLVLLNPDELVCRVFVNAGIDRIVPILEQLDDAIALFRTT